MKKTTSEKGTMTFKAYDGGKIKNVEIEKTTITGIVNGTRQFQNEIAVRSKNLPHLLKRVVTR